MLILFFAIESSDKLIIVLGISFKTGRKVVEKWLSFGNGVHVYAHICNYMPYHVPLERSLEWKSLPEDARLSGFLGVVLNPVACRASLSDWARSKINKKIIFPKFKIHFENLFIVCLNYYFVRYEHQVTLQVPFMLPRLNMLKWLIRAMSN